MMGWGDEFIASGQAKRAQQTDPRRVHILDRHGAPRWHPLWDGNPRLARPGEIGDFQPLVNGPGDRPYIATKTAHRWLWKKYDCTPGEIYFSEAEHAFAARHRPQVIIEPTIKASASPNKNWGIQRWQEFARLARKAGIELVQLRPSGTRSLYGATTIYTPDFRSACAVLANAQAYVGHEGGMHHAAAALGIPAVVIFGGFISPAQTGYADPALRHRNLFTGGEPCGMRVRCKHCDEAMAAISPGMVLNELKILMNGDGQELKS